jgi:hypothetical protein
VIPIKCNTESMSKTKLALMVFVLAFGVNIAAFVLSKKVFVVEEVKNLWLYELPQSSSPLDAYVAEDLGPHQGIIGTLYRLKESSEWKTEKGKPATLVIHLKSGLTFSDHQPILPEHWIASAQWARPYLSQWSADPLWSAYLAAETKWISSSDVQWSWKSLPTGFDEGEFQKKILSHPMTGVFHPENLKLKLPKKNWISSGPYRIRKWNPKEIVLVSRDDFPVTIPKEFFRTLKYQSAPVKNPSCDFMQAQPGEEKPLEDHRVVKASQMLHLFWACRSWKEAGSFCSSVQNRENFAKSVSGSAEGKPEKFSPARLRYRIPQGSDAFRNEIVKKISSIMSSAGGATEEISYFFKPSSEADIELLFVVTDSRVSSENAAKMAVFSSRLGLEGEQPPANLVGEFAKLPVQYLMKNMQGEPFSKVFLEPDLEEKKLPL